MKPVDWRSMRCRACGQREGLQDAIADLRMWAISRIHWCRMEEAKLGVSGIGIYEASQERRTLQAVLRQLGCPEEDFDSSGANELRRKP